MACFTVPVAEAIVTTVITKVVKSKEKKEEERRVSLGEQVDVTSHKIPFSRKMKWLNILLWGGSALLAFEHIWHGEVTPWFPFLTAASNASDTAEMMHEIATSGVAMAVLVTAIWAGMLAVTHVMEKRAEKASKTLISTDK